MTLPELFVHRLEQLGELLDTDLATTLARRPDPVFRIRSEAEAVLAQLRTQGLTPTPVPGLRDAWSVPPEQRPALTAAPPCEDGSIYIQGASSQRVVDVLAPEPGEQILDLAAAPVETILIADRTGQRAAITAVEVVRSRYFRLLANLERCEVTCVEASNRDGRRVPRGWTDRFDRVLLDAPCSSEARFTTLDPKSYAKWSLGKVRDMGRKQWGLLGAALRCVRPGGEVVYSTCSFAPEENEQVVAAYLRDDAVELLEIGHGDTPPPMRPGLTSWQKKTWPDELARTARILPDRHHEAFFVARLRKSGQRTLRNCSATRSATRSQV